MAERQADSSPRLWNPSATPEQTENARISTPAARQDLKVLPSPHDINHRAIVTDQARRLLASQGIHQVNDPARQGCQLTPVCQHGINRLSERAIKNRRLGDIPRAPPSTSRQPEPRITHQCPSQPLHTPHEVDCARDSRLPMVSAAGEQYIDRSAI
ncbi:hypothetical protein ACFY04_11605 [Streptomyces sp. NPDC001549]|uniref:hypothetical protein n=1 Tax=Streptomyces sp. NPDC001549 TaxID=3364586 RepID=UPI003698E6CD